MHLAKEWGFYFKILTCLGNFARKTTWVVAYTLKTRPIHSPHGRASNSAKYE